MQKNYTIPEAHTLSFHMIVENVDWIPLCTAIKLSSKDAHKTVSMFICESFRLANKKLFP